MWSRVGEMRSVLVVASQGTSPAPLFRVTPSLSPCRAASRWKDALLHSQGNGLDAADGFDLLSGAFDSISYRKQLVGDQQETIKPSISSGESGSSKI